VLRPIARTVVALAAAAGLVAGVADAVAAQQQRFQLYAIGGGYFATDLYVGTSVNNKVKLSDSWTYGGRLVYFPQRQFGIELSYARAVSNVTADTGFGEADRGDVALDQIDISGIYASQQGPASGYLSIGIGSTILSPHITDLPRPQSGRFAWNIGLGGMFQFGESMVARLDGRYRGMNTNRSTGTNSWCDGFGYCYGYASWVYWSGEVTAGLGFRF
jgi:opacity protein-like surface antigen